MKAIDAVERIVAPATKNHDKGEAEHAPSPLQQEQFSVKTIDAVERFVAAATKNEASSPLQQGTLV